MQISGFMDWIGVLRPHLLTHLLPGAACTALILATMHRARHPLALPGVLLAVPAAFHLVLLAGGWSLKDAQDGGWLTKPVSCSEHLLHDGMDSEAPVHIYMTL